MCVASFYAYYYFPQERLFLKEIALSWDLIKQGLQTNDNLNHKLTNHGWAKTGLLACFRTDCGHYPSKLALSHEDPGPVRKRGGSFPMLVSHPAATVAPSHCPGSVPIATYTSGILLWQLVCTKWSDLSPANDFTSEHLSRLRWCTGFGPH